MEGNTSSAFGSHTSLQPSIATCRPKRKKQKKWEDQSGVAEYLNELPDSKKRRNLDGGLYASPADVPTTIEVLGVKAEPSEISHSQITVDTDNQIITKQEVIYKEEIFGSDENVESHVGDPFSDVTSDMSTSGSGSVYPIVSISPVMLGDSINPVFNTQPNHSTNSEHQERVMSNYTEAKINMSKDLIEDMLPSIFSHKVITCDYMSDNNIPGVNLEIDCSLTTLEDIKYWLQEFSERSCTNWKYSCGMGSLSSIYKVMFVCKGSFKPKREKGKGARNCKAFIHIKLYDKETTRKTSGVSEGFSSRITLSFVHNHPVVFEEALEFKTVQQEVTELFRQYFSEGYSPGSAHHFYQTRLWLRDSASEIMCDNSVNPKLQTVKYMWDSWRREKRQKACRSKSNNSVEPSSYDHILEKVQKMQQEQKLSLYIFKNAVVLTIVTPMMIRAHSTLEAGLTVFVDTVTNCGDDKFSVTYLTCATVAGVLPLGAVVISNATCEYYRTAFKNLVNIVGEKSFGNRGQPVMFICDGFEPCKEALKQCFPDSNALLCVTHLLRVVWKWLGEASNGIKEQDRATLIDLVKNVLYASTPELSKTAYRVMLAHDVFKQYGVFKTYMATLWNRRGDVGLLFKLPVNNMQFNELSKRIFVDAILIKCQLFSIIPLIDYICIAVEECFQQRIVEFIENSSCPYTFLSCLDVKTLPEIKTHKTSHKVKSMQDQDVWFSVETVPSVCSCESGKIGGFCVHQRAVWKRTKSQTPAMPILDETDRLRIAEIAFGESGYQSCNKREFDALVKSLKKNLVRLEGIANQNITKSFVDNIKKFNQALSKISNLNDLWAFSESAANLQDQRNIVHTNQTIIQQPSNMLHAQTSAQPQANIVHSQTNNAQFQQPGTVPQTQSSILQPNSLIPSQSGVGVGSFQFFVVQPMNR